MSPGSVVFADGDLEVRRLAEADVASMARWLSDPRVAEWYEGRDRPYDEVMVRAKFLRPDDSVWRCLVVESGVPIGYLQVYEADVGDPAREGRPEAERVCGIDLFIGDPSLWNAGRGSRLVRAAARYLIEAWGADRVTIDPLVRNGRAVRAYEKAGFRTVRRLSAHERIEGEWRDAWLMAFAPDASEPPA